MGPAAKAHGVPARWTRHIAGLAAAAGADPVALWETAGIDPETLGREISEDAHLRLWEAVMRALDDPGFPVRVASDRSIDEYDLLGLACKTSRTIRDALAHMIRYLQIWTSQYRCALKDADDGAELILRGPAGGLGRRCADESAVAQIVKAMRDVCQQHARPVRACFEHASPGDIGEHESFFGCPVEFGAAFTGLALSTATLETELALADDGLSYYLVRQLADLAARSSQTHPLLDRVRAIVTELLPSGAPKLAAVASRLAMSSRTLQRQLAAAETSFAELTERIRRDLAVELLRVADRSIAEISFVLGFSERSAFQRAFKRWTGATPASFRRR